MTVATPEAEVKNAPPPVIEAERESRRYNLVILGLTPLGYHAALEAARFGARVALAATAHDELPWREDRQLVKVLSAAARLMHQARASAEHGIECAGVSVDFAKLIERAKQFALGLAARKPMEALRAANVEVFTEPARFAAKNSLGVAGRTIQFQKALIATGVRPRTLEIPGVQELAVRNERDIAELNSLPARLIVIGGGPTGCEFAQAFRRLGSSVQLVEQGPTLLAREEPHAAEVIQRRLERDGVRLQLGWKPIAVERMGGAKCVVIERDGERLKLIADEVLGTVGHVPNTEHLALDRAGVRADEQGVEVDDYLRTSNPSMYAAGESTTASIVGDDAESLAKLVVRNAILLGRSRMSRRFAPRCFSTSPEVARIGLTRAEAAERGLRVESYRQELCELPSAALSEANDGYAVLHVEAGGDRLLGATLVAEHASEMIGELSLAMNRRLGLAALAESLPACPAQAEIISRIAQRHRPTRVTPKIEGWIGKWLAWRRGDKRGAAAS